MFVRKRYNSTRNSLQARVSLRRYTSPTVYLQHGGGNFCRQNDVNVTDVQKIR